MNQKLRFPGTGFAFAAMLCGAMLMGCDRSESAAEVLSALPKSVEGAGVVRGRVLFGGMPPVMEFIANQPCHSGSEPLTEETVLVNDDGSLRNVIVYVKGAPVLDGSDHSPALLDQVNCRFEPHVIGVQIGQALRVTSSDPTMHNVHYRPRSNPADNFALTGAGQERTVVFSSPEFIRARCDVHPWMLAHIGVFENPFFAITGDGGTFEITGLPDGRYELIAWHEKYGEQSQPIEIADGNMLDMQFEYRQP